MGYALVPLVRPEPRKGDREQGRRPFGYDQSAHNFIVLDPGDKTQPSSGLCLAWFEEDLSDGRVEKIADGHEERMSVVARAKLGAALGGRAFRNEPFNAQIAEFLKSSGQLRPSVRRQRYEIYLGPPGSRLFYAVPAPPVKHSIVLADDFTRANAALNGSSLSGGTGTWDSSVWAVVSNQCVATAMADGAHTTAIPSVEADTDDNFCQIDLLSLAATAADEIAFRLFTAVDAATPTGGYRLQVGEEVGVETYRSVFAIQQDVSLGTDTDTSPLVGTLRVERDGSTITASIDGTPILGSPFTNSGEPTGVGTRFQLFSGRAFGALAAGAVVTVDNFAGGDLVAPSVVRQMLQFHG